jgi:sugar phosphate isomerase/epimerase
MPRYVVLEHVGAPDDPAGRHFDLLLEAGAACRTWRLLTVPTAGGDAVAALELPPHRLVWLERVEGEVSGGRGFARRIDAGEYEVLASDAAELSAASALVLAMTGGVCAGRLRLQATGNGWAVSLGRSSLSPMRYAICNETYVDWPFAKACEHAASCGYTGLEIAPFTLASLATEVAPSARAELRRTMQAAGLECVGLHWLLAKTEGFHATHPDPAVRQRTVEYLGELARLCVDLGGRVLVFGSPKQRSLLPGVSHEQATHHLEEVFSRLVPVLEATGTVVALEPLSPVETDVLTTAKETCRLIERIGSPHVRLHLDVKAMSSEPLAIPDIIHASAGHLEHFHANDVNLQGPGFGDVDFVPIFRALDEIHYTGWVSVEVFDYAPGAERLAGESIDFMRRTAAAVAGF